MNDQNKKTKIDAAEATRIVRGYFEEQSGPLGVLFFRVESVTPNTEEGVYKVRCSFYPTPGSSKLSRYEVRVNIDTREIVDVIELEDG